MRLPDLAFAFALLAGCSHSGVDVGTNNSSTGGTNNTSTGGTNNTSGTTGSNNTSGTTNNSTCQYDDFPGKCTVTAVRDPMPTESACANDGKVVEFDFMPIADGDSTTGTLTIGDGKAPPQQCLTANGVMVGTQFDCIRSDITSGTCTPTVIEPASTSNILDGCEAACSN